MHRSEQLCQLVELRSHPLDIRAVEHRTKPIHPGMNPIQKAHHVRIDCFLQVSYRHGILYFEPSERASWLAETSNLAID